MRIPNLMLSVSGLVLIAACLSIGPAVQDAHAQHSPDLENGRAVYEHWCSHCHDGGRGMPGTQSLQIKYDGEVPAVLLERDDLTPTLIRTFVRQGILSMPPFRKTEITERELDDLAAYMSQ